MGAGFKGVARVTLRVLVTAAVDVLCDVWHHKHLPVSEELRCGIEISAGLPKYVFLILRKSFAWHWCLFYRGGGGCYPSIERM